jgi:hypothetical protein
VRLCDNGQRYTLRQRRYHSTNQRTVNETREVLRSSSSFVVSHMPFFDFGSDSVNEQHAAEKGSISFSTPPAYKRKKAATYLMNVSDCVVCHTHGVLTIDSVDILLQDRTIPFSLHLRQADLDVNLFLYTQVGISDSPIYNKDERRTRREVLPHRSSLASTKTASRSCAAPQPLSYSSPLPPPSPSHPCARETVQICVVHKDLRAYQVHSANSSFKLFCSGVPVMSSRP